MWAWNRLGYRKALFCSCSNGGGEFWQSCVNANNSKCRIYNSSYFFCRLVAFSRLGQISSLASSCVAKLSSNRVSSPYATNGLIEYLWHKNWMCCQRLLINVFAFYLCSRSSQVRTFLKSFKRSSSDVVISFVLTGSKSHIARDVYRALLFHVLSTWERSAYTGQLRTWYVCLYF